MAVGRNQLTVAATATATATTSNTTTASMITAAAKKDASAQQTRPVVPHQPQQKQQQPQSSLALLSSIAMMISDGQNEHEHEHENCLDRVRGNAVAKASVKASASIAPVTSAVNTNANTNNDGHGFGPKLNMGGLSRSLSRMDLSYLAMNMVAPLSYQQHQPPQQPQQNKSTSTPAIGSCAVTSSTVVVTQQHTTIANTNSSSPMILQNYNHYSNIDAELSIATTAAAAKASKGPLATPSASATATLCTPPDDIIKNVYRSYEMHLPESSTHTAGRILPIYCCGKNNNGSHNSKGDKVDDYNNDLLDDYNNDIMVTECYSPLRDPPRLPDPRESSSIAKRSREERNNWGWYT